MDRFRPRFSRKWKSVSGQESAEEVVNEKDPRTTEQFKTQNISNQPRHTQSDQWNDAPGANQTFFQAFEWYSPGSQLDQSSVRLRTISHWEHVTELLPMLTKLGISLMWIPPACKATSVKDNGYGIYDLYDLGEYDQKGTIGTKWGTKEQLVRLCKEAEKNGVGVVFDAVLNHRATADDSERVQAVQVSEKDRRIEIGKPQEIESWSKFEYSGRGGQHSTMKYNAQHFSGTSWDALSKTKGIFKYTGNHRHGWAKDVSCDENGNYDYLMFEDVNYYHPDVRQDVLNWTSWVPRELPGVKGFRLDAIKHYSSGFQRELVAHVHKSISDDFFFVGEYWRADSKKLANHIDKSFNGRMNLFDVKLVYNLSEASRGSLRDLRKILNNTLVELKPHQAVTFVANHDTQESQSLAAPVEQWFVPHAYALILLRENGLPCVFWGDLYGNAGPKEREPACGGRLARLLLARKLYAYGKQIDYLKDDPSCIGWTRSGHSHHSNGDGLAVLISNNWGWRKKRMYVGKQHAGNVWADIMGWAWSGVQIDKEGFGEFPVAHRSISVWAPQRARGRQEIDKLVYPRLQPLPAENLELSSITAAE